MKHTENQRLKFLMHELGFKTQSSFAKSLKMKAGTLSDIFRQKEGVGVSDRTKRILENSYNVNIDWLETGQGDMLLSEGASVQDGAPYYPSVNVSAGLAFLTENDGSHPESYIKVPGISVDAYINVFGDSMYPKYQSGQIIGIKQVEKDMIHFGYAYVIEMQDGEPYIKYIQPGEDSEHWSLESENAHFKPKQFHLSKIRKVFKIKSVLTRESL